MNSTSFLEFCRLLCVCVCLYVVVVVELFGTFKFERAEYDNKNNNKK